MIVYLTNKTPFRADILFHRIEEIVHESMNKELGKSVGASESASWKNSPPRSGALRTASSSSLRPANQSSPHPDHFTAKPGFFLAQVVGESMNRRIPTGWASPRNLIFSPASPKATTPKGPHSEGPNVEMRHLTSSIYPPVPHTASQTLLREPGKKLWTAAYPLTAITFI